MSDLVLLTGAQHTSAEVLPGLGLLSHRVRILPLELATLPEAGHADAIVVDGRADLTRARDLCRAAAESELGPPVLLVVTEGGMTAVATDWGFADVVLTSSGPAEIEARLRLITGRGRAVDDTETVIRHAGIEIDESAYVVKVSGRPLELTFKEFELLRYLVQHPGRVFTREQLLQEVWGYDYFGGSRTVDVHVRRLRAKLGADRETLIGTVRNVGYRFVPASDDADETSSGRRGG